jgi:MFS family permease
MEGPSRPDDESTAGQSQERSPERKVGADAPQIETDLPNKTLVYSSIVAFLAWVFSVYDYTLFGTLLPQMADDLGWSTATSTAVATWVGVGVFIVSLTVGPLLDYLGRKTSLILTTAGAAISSGLTALSFSALYVVIIRAFSGLGYSEQVVNTTYLNELYGTRQRRGSSTASCRAAGRSGCWWEPACRRCCFRSSGGGACS